MENTLKFKLSHDSKYYIVKAKNTLISGTLEIPAEYEGLPVKEIADDGFRDCSKLTSISLPATITIIGLGAFQDCFNLSSISLPAGLTNIWGYAFAYCASLTSIEIPATVTSIGNYAFCGCRSLTSFKFDGNAVAEATGILGSTSKLTEVHVNTSSKGFDSTWAGKPVVIG